jgi:Flp pilus assembly protein TadD
MSYRHLFGDAKATAREGDGRRKQRAYDEALAQHQANPTFVTQAKLATTLFDLGRFEEAERLLKDILEHSGDDIQVLTDLAFVYKNLNRLEDARQAFLKVIVLDPKHSLARCAENELWTMDPSYKPSWMRK